MDYYGSMSIFKPMALLLLAWAALATATVQAQTSEPAPPAVPSGKSALNSEIFYQLLLGEINAQSGEPAFAYPYLLDAARKTKDGKLFQRAVEVALQARSGDSALQAARTWRQTIPNSKEANQFLLQILIGLNRLPEVVEPLKRELTTTNAKDRPAIIAAIPRFFTRAADKKTAASVVEQVLADQFGNTETGVAAWTAIGRMRLEAGDAAGALDAARRGQALNPKSEDPALLALALMSPKMPQAEAIVRQYLEGAKPLPAVRQDYARALVNSRRYAEAAAQLQIVTSEQPEEATGWLILGTLELQERKRTAAEKSFMRYLDLVSAQKDPSPRHENKQGLVQAYLSLAQIAEERGDMEKAHVWLGRIDNADALLGAQSRRAAILARQGKLDEARQLIRDLPEEGQINARMKLAAEVQLLRDSKQFRTAYDLVAQALAKDDQDVGLLYDQAMLAEKLGDLDDMERLLRRVIVLNPEYHHAYNALGYSLAERGIRLPEARQLILKSLEFAPGDPFITDSLGWVEFRSGNLAEALRLLHSAYKEKPDAEIGAHLGEVLWVMGERNQALMVWRESVEINGESDTLRETLKRLGVTL